MQLCIDARLITTAGIGTYLKNLIPKIKEGPFQLKLIVHPESLKTLNWLSSYDLIQTEAPIYSIREQLELPFLIPQCDLFWSPNFNVPIFPIRAKKRLVTIHDLYHLAFYSSLTWAQKIYARKIISAAVKKSDRIITDSQFSYKELLHYTEARKEKIRVISLGVDPERFHDRVDRTLNDKIRSHYQLPEKFILFVGNVKPHKNIKGLLQAFSYLEGENLVIVGRRKGLITADAVLPMEDVLYLETVKDEDLPYIYQLATVTILPSFYEGFGLPALEAMSCGCPMIVSDRASLTEICGDAALYVNPDDPKDMADKLKAVLSNSELRETLRKKGIEKSRTFCWNECAQKHIEYFLL